MIDGRGTKQNFPGSETVGATPGRPFLIRVLDCQGVHVTGLHLRDAACWMQNYLNCEDLLIEHLRVEDQANFNNDGLDIDGCRRVIVRHCDINSEAHPGSQPRNRRAGARDQRDVAQPRRPDRESARG